MVDRAAPQAIRGPVMEVVADRTPRPASEAAGVADARPAVAATSEAAVEAATPAVVVEEVTPVAVVEATPVADTADIARSKRKS